jgi:hypothetical protein
MSNFMYDINTYVKLDSTLVALSGKTSLQIRPAVGYENEEAPVILWWYTPAIRNPEMPFWRIDRLHYYLLDTDAERCIAMGERIISLLNLSDKARRAVASPSYHGKWIFLAQGNFDGPAEREGWYRFRIDFEVSYMPVP